MIKVGKAVPTIFVMIVAGYKFVYETLLYCALWSLTVCIFLKTLHMKRCQNGASVANTSECCTKLRINAANRKPA